MTIEKTKNLKTITTEELLGSLITHEHTLETDQKEKQTYKKNKKDLTLQLLMRNIEDFIKIFTQKTLRSY